MAISEFRYNKRRQHYPYDFGRKLSNWSFDVNDKRKIKRLIKGKKV